MKSFIQLSLEEREKLYIAKMAGKLRRQIARELERDPSTVGRELKRNTCDDELAYLPDRAQKLYEERKH